MPGRAPSICGHCGGVHPRGETCARGARLKRERGQRHDAKRGNSSARGYDGAWERAASAYLAEPGNQSCARCGDPATVVMHIQSIRIRPDLRMVRSNWRAGCRRCNAIEAAEERRPNRSTPR